MSDVISVKQHLSYRYLDESPCPKCDCTHTVISGETRSDFYERKCPVCLFHETKRHEHRIVEP